MIFPEKDVFPRTSTSSKKSSSDANTLAMKAITQFYIHIKCFEKCFSKYTALPEGALGTAQNYEGYYSYKEVLRII